MNYPGKITPVNTQEVMIKDGRAEAITLIKTFGEIAEFALEIGDLDQRNKLLQIIRDNAKHYFLSNQLQLIVK